MYAIRNTATGQQYRPASRGYTDYLYATRYDAEQAVRAMPPRWRDVYEVVEVSFRVVVGDDQDGLDSARFPTRREAEDALATLDDRRCRSERESGTER
jgi:hypothetical protein